MVYLMNVHLLKVHQLHLGALNMAWDDSHEVAGQNLGVLLHVPSEARRMRYIRSKQVQLQSWRHPFKSLLLQLQLLQLQLLLLLQLQLQRLLGCCT